MRKFVSILISLTLIGSSASAFQLDRAFDSDRTLYYAYVDDDEVPNISYDGYSLQKKATSVASGDVGKDNVTILKNDETGVLYRFVLLKTSAYTVDISNTQVSSSGVVSMSGTTNETALYAVISKPTAKYSETGYEWTAENVNESAISDVKAVDITDGELSLSYTIPSDSVSGEYDVTFIGQNNTYKTDGFYYTSPSDSAEALVGLNDICSETKSSENEEKLVEYINANYKGLYLDLTYFNEFTASEKVATAERLFGESYADCEALAKAFYQAVSLVWCNDGKDANKVIDAYNTYFDFGLYDEYVALKSKTLIAEAVKSEKSADDFVKDFDKAVAISIINEAEPKAMNDNITELKDYLGLSDNIYAKYLTNTTKCDRALCNKSFKTVAEIENAITNALKETKKESSGGGGGGGGSSSTVVTAPAVGTVEEETSDTIYEPDNEKITDTTLPFVDLAGYDWAEDAIKHLYINQMISGKTETELAPSDNITREEFTKLVAVAFDLSSKADVTKFKDLESDAWYTESIGIAVANGIINGIAEDEFGLATPIKREDMAVILKRVIDHNRLSFDIVVDDVAEFSDYDDIDDYAKDAVDYLAELGIVKGDDGRFNPAASATRAEAIVMIYNVIKIR